MILGTVLKTKAEKEEQIILKKGEKEAIKFEAEITRKQKNAYIWEDQKIKPAARLIQGTCVLLLSGMGDMASLQILQLLQGQHGNVINNFMPVNLTA